MSVEPHDPDYTITKLTMFINHLHHLCHIVFLFSNAHILFSVYLLNSVPQDLGRRNFVSLEQVAIPLARADNIDFAIPNINQ